MSKTEAGSVWELPMPVATASRVLACLIEPGDVPDSALLARFARDRDETAFAAIVRRHGPMVLGVCRRIVCDSHTADDAFQATFLVLSRKASLVHPADGLAGWLHGVARRAALEARTVARRRSARETLMPNIPEADSCDPELPDHELLARLDRAVAALPAQLRTAVVLCELEGRSRREAANLLGIPEGTLSSRLANARKRLTARLRRVPNVATVTVSSALARRAAQAAGQPNMVPANVIALATRVTRMLAATRLKALAAAAVVLAGLATLFAPPRPADAADPRAKAAPVVREAQILVWVKGKAAILKPDGTVVQSWEGDQIPDVAGVRMSPD